MFIRKKTKVDPKTSKKYFSYQLVESTRTERGPRQAILMTIGNNFDLSDQERKLLANRIEELNAGIISFFKYPTHIESLAHMFAKQLIRKQSIPCITTKNTEENDYHVVNINSVENEHIRQVGVEHICLETIRNLKIDLKLKELGFTERQVQLAIAAIIGRLDGNVSELATYEWMQSISGLEELLNTSFDKLSINTLYKVADTLQASKKQIEAYLHQQETNLFSLENTIALYDLTNVYFEGSVKGNSKAKKGRSKDKRSDCPLLTLGVVFNSSGFPIVSDIFEGNVSEPKTLEPVLNRLQLPSNICPIIILDAGLATESNIKWLQTQNKPYIVCSRKRNQNIPEGLSLQLVKEKKGQSVYAACKPDSKTGETIVYCRSEAKLASEKKWQSDIQKRFEDALLKMNEGLKKKNCTKSYQIILERIGRLKERYSRISQYYQINVKKNKNEIYAQSLDWVFQEEEATNRFDGGYCLRVYGLEWTCQKLWDTYIMLTKAEEGFRNLKSHLGLRPIFHHKEARADSHLFITMLAYHVMKTVLYQLEAKNIHIQWNKLRDFMRTHGRVMTTFQNKEGKKIHIRSTSNPEIFHKEIYLALGLNNKPLQKIKTII